MSDRSDQRPTSSHVGNDGHERYTFRTTTDQLLKHMATVEEAGDVVRSEHFVGGRDWLLIVERAAR